VSHLSRFSSTVASMTRHHHHQHNSASTSCLDSAIASMTQHQRRAVAKLPRQHHRRHDSVATSRHDQHRLGSTVISMTWELGAYFPDQQSDSEVHHRSGSRAGGVPLQPISPTSTRGECVITTMLWDTSPNQLSHFLSCIIF
jgi:hypothetical protein